MSEYHLAQLNVGRVVAPLDDPVMADFMNNLDRINGLAEATPGFVWRLQDDSGNATGIEVSDDPHFIINLSVWESVDALFEFVYRTGHADFLGRRKEWFEPFGKPYVVLWWVPAGTTPSAEEALRRLEMLTERGPGPDAFTFKQRFGPPPAAPEAVGSADAAD